jgi:hypothetical protein
MERNIYGYACQKCGALHYPFRMRCKECGQNDFFEFDPVALPKHGRLVTFTYVHNLPAEYEVERLGLGVVELDNGIRMVGQLDIDGPVAGMEVSGRVEIVRQETYDDFYGMVFSAT